MMTGFPFQIRVLMKTLSSAVSSVKTKFEARGSSAPSVSLAKSPAQPGSTRSLSPSWSLSRPSEQAETRLVAVAGREARLNWRLRTFHGVCKISLTGATPVTTSAPFSTTTTSLPTARGALSKSSCATLLRDRDSRTCLVDHTAPRSCWTGRTCSGEDQP